MNDLTGLQPVYVRGELRSQSGIGVDKHVSCGTVAVSLLFPLKAFKCTKQ